MKKAILVLFALSLLLSCKRTETDPVPEDDYLIFGYYACFCLDCCTMGFKITGDELYRGEKISQGSYQFETTPLPTDDYVLAKPLVDELPDELLAEDGKLFGCGGCLDEPLYFVELKKDGTVYRWRIDSDVSSLPVYLQAFTTRLTDVIGQLK